MYSSAVFTGSQCLCSQILRGQDRPPSTNLCIRKLETLDYPIVKTAFPRFDRVTDRRIVRHIRGCRASFVACCKSQPKVGANRHFQAR